MTTAAEGKIRLILFLNVIGYGGLGRTMSDVSCRLPENVEQTVVLLEDRIMYPYRGRLRILGKNCLKRLPVKGLRVLLNALKFRKLIKEIRPDVVLCFHHDTRVINFLAGKFLPFFRYKTNIAALGLTKHYEKYFPGSRTRIHRFFVFQVLRHADRILAVTEGVKADMIRGYNVDHRKIDVVYGSVDLPAALEQASEAVDHPWFSEDVPVVILSGRLVFEKGHADLLRAFATVRSERTCRLAFVGDGPEKDALIRLARTLGISGDVLFLGYQKNPFKFVARSTVFAFPSVFEAQGLVILEAMAAGRPVVAYDCPVGPREMLAPGTTTSADGAIELAEYGILVPVGRVELLAQAIRVLLDDPDLHGEYSRKGRERAKCFDPQKMADAYLASFGIPGRNA